MRSVYGVCARAAKGYIVPKACSSLHTGVHVKKCIASGLLLLILSFGARGEIVSKRAHELAHWQVGDVDCSVSREKGIFVFKADVMYGHLGRTVQLMKVAENGALISNVNFPVDKDGKMRGEEEPAKYYYLHNQCFKYPPRRKRNPDNEDSSELIKRTRVVPKEALSAVGGYERLYESFRTPRTAKAAP